MPIGLSRYLDPELCHGHSWSVIDEDALAAAVAHVLLGYHHHAQAILNQLSPGEITPRGKVLANLKDDLRDKFVDEHDSRTWHRDGWVFQAISWCAATIGRPGLLITLPHARKADKGFDSLAVELDATGAALAVIISEDKATENPRSMFSGAVLTELRSLEQGNRDRELTVELSALLGSHGFDAEASQRVMESAVWEDARNYRVCMTVSPADCDDQDARARMFKDYDTAVLGSVSRRQAEYFALDEMRTWMSGFAAKVLAAAERQAANV